MKVDGVQISANATCTLDHFEVTCLCSFNNSRHRTCSLQRNNTSGVLLGSGDAER